MGDEKLGKLEKMELRKVWKDEAGQFTPWLAQEGNLKILSDAIGIPLELVRTEQPVQEFSADIHCRDMDSGMPVLIENQLEKTDHSHLGQILTYAAGLEAVVVVWIAQRFTEAHRAALDWLNEITEEKFGFFGVEIELWHIGDSDPAPRFSVVAKPNDWSREIRASTARAGLTDYQRLQLEYWTSYGKCMSDSKVPRGPAMPRNFIDHPLGIGRLRLYSVADMFGQTESGKAPQLRAEFGVKMSNPGPAFDWFEQRKSDIETKLGWSLVWDRESYSGGYHRAYVAKDGDLRNRDEWSGQFVWLCERIEKMYDVFLPLVKEYEKTH